MKCEIFYGISKKTNTDTLLNKAVEQIKIGTNYPIYIIVPEQYTSEYEERIANDNRFKGNVDLNVISFKRLAHKVFINSMIIRDKYISKAGKSVLVYNILQKRKEELEVFKKASKYPNFSKKIANMFVELKRYGVTSEDLLSLKSIKDDSLLLKSKLTELALLFNDYNKEIKDKDFNDSDNDISLLSKTIKESDVMNNSHIYIDRFFGFTPQEYGCIDAFIKKSSTVTIALCSNTLKKCTIKNVFFPVYETYEKIYKLCENNNYLPKETSVKYNEKKNDELVFLEEQFFNFEDKKYVSNPKNISIYQAGNIYEEIKRAGYIISQLVRSGEYRYKDIKIGCSSLDEYKDYIKDVFYQYDIPVYLNEKRPLNKHALITYILSILKIYRDKYTYETVFDYVKSPFSGIPPSSGQKLENYVLRWNIKGKKVWSEPFTKYDEKSRSSELELEEINETRNSIFSKLNEFYEKVNYNRAPKEFFKELYNFITTDETKKILNEYINESNENYMQDYADELVQSLNIIVDCFNQITEVIKHEKHTIEYYLDLLIVAFLEYEIGVIPPNNDKVAIGNIERNQDYNTKVYYILGVNQLSFPSSIINNGIISDADRILLKEKGMAIAPTVIGQSLEQRLLEHSAITLPSEKLYLSYTISDFNHKSRNPAQIIKTIKSIFINLKIEYMVNENDFILTAQMGLSEVYNSKELKKWYEENEYPLYMSLCNQIPVYDIDNDEIVKLLYGDTLNSSVSELETYAKCEFLHFLKYGLRIKEREEYEISYPEIGNLIHIVLGNLVKSNIEFNEASNYVDKMYDEHISNHSIFRSSKRYEFLGNRVKEKILYSYSQILKQNTNGTFIPKEFEVSFGVNKDLPPIVIDSKEGKKIILKGIIDRVDTTNINDEEYFRIIDYKLSNKSIELYKIKAGIDLQLLLYLYAYSKSKKINPAGMYYFATSNGIMKSDSYLDDNQVEEGLMKQARLRGYTLENDNVIISNDKNFIKKSNIIDERKKLSKEKIEEIFSFMEKDIKKKVSGIFNLNRDVNPINDCNSIPCSYCKFKSICGFDEKNGYKYIEKNKDEDVIFDD